MEKFKGTFGKWTIGGISTDGVFIGAKESIRDIATVYKYDDSFLERQEMEANAKLISCAPEMLEALQNIINASYLPEHVNDQIIATIKKATTI